MRTKKLGSYTPLEVLKLYNTQTEIKPGCWVIARPIPYYSIVSRLIQAYDVLRYKADALYWE